MKPAPFDYFAPVTVAEALDTLDRLGYDGKVLAGGQSLIAAMNFRMARPAALVDLNNIPDLFFIRPASDGGFLIGTMTRESKVEHDPIIPQKYALIGDAMPHIGHPQIRNRGTFGGCMAHADPAGQLPGVAVALGTRFHVRSKSNDRWVDAQKFFAGPFTTVMEPQEMLVEVTLPALPPRSGSSYQQVSRQRGSQAQLGVAVFVTLDERNRCKDARIVVICVGETPVLAHQACQMLVGQSPSAELYRAAGQMVASKEIDPGTDIHATADYRRHVADVLVRRALASAFERGGGKGG